MSKKEETKEPTKRPVGRPKGWSQSENTARKKKEAQAKVDAKMKQKRARSIRNPRAKREIPETHPYLTQKELTTLNIICPLSIKHERFLQDEEHDIIVWGGAASAGKTQLSLMKILLSANYDPDFTGVIVRKSQRQMKQAGSLWSSGKRMLAPFGVSSNNLEMAWTFPNGAEAKCHHLDGNTDDFQGGQYTKILADEAQQLEEEDIWYLTSRLRSMSKQKHQLLMTCNPLNTSFLARWLVKAGYIGEDGLPIKEQDGKTKFMVQVVGEFEWYESFKEVEKLYGREIAKTALKFTYYSATVYDNPYVRRFLPTYVHKLENLKEVEKQRLLLGNWFAQEEGVGYAKQEQFNTCRLDDIPLGSPVVRAWDLASTEPTPTYPNPDWTVGVKGTYEKDSGFFYILDVVRLRKQQAQVQATIEATAQADGNGTYIVVPIDAGAAGKTVAEQKKARLMRMGHRVVLEVTRKSKLVRAEPFLIALQEGKVFVPMGVLTDEDYRELSNFDGKRNNGSKDDLMDAIASCYNNLIDGSLIPTIRMGNNNNRMYRMNLGGSTLL